jgi:thiamine pyrophosphokinase
MKTVIFLAARLKRADTVRMLIGTPDFTAAADGGAVHAKALGLRLDLLAGDFDSLDEQTRMDYERDGTKIVKVPEKKDLTDAELTVELMLEIFRKRGVAEKSIDLFVVGATGGRRDHEYQTLLYLASLSPRIASLTLCDGKSLMRLYTGPAEDQIVWPPCDLRAKRPLYVSFLALSDEVEGLSYDGGLVYPLQDFTLIRGSTRGVSNESTDRFKAKFRFGFRQGTLLLIVTP